MTTKKIGARLAAASGLALGFLNADPAWAAEYWLRAEATTLTMPGGAVVPMWAFARCTDATFTACDPASVPGPGLVVPSGEGLTVNLRNALAAPVSLVIPGQVTAMTPVWDTGATGARPSATARVRSFTHETAPGATAVYSWPTLKDGTYLYHSGTHPQVQVQMGLYGAMTRDFAAGMAYPGVAVDAAVTLVYSEIDPDLHTAVGGPVPTYGTPAGPTSTLNYRPRYFLINGKPHSAGDPAIATVAVDKTTLLRFVNAGLTTRVPVIDDPYMRMIAEDGNPSPWGSNPRQRYSVFLPAAKTTDATIRPEIAGPTRIAIYDRTLALTNNTATGGGMLAFLDVSAAGSDPTITSVAVTAATQGQPYTYAVTATDPDGGTLTFSLVTAPGGMTINGATGVISWTPTAAQVGSHPVTVRVTDPTARFAEQSYTLVVAADTLAQPPAFTSTPVIVATYGQPYAYVAAATDPEAGAVTYSLDVAPAGMTIDATTGAIAWTPQKTQVGTADVTVRATDPTTLFATQAFTIAVADANYAPTAVANAYTMVQGGTLTVAAPGVLGNDTDPDGDALTAVPGTAPVDGTFSLASDGGFTYAPPAAVAGTTRTFTYSAQDTAANTSGTATVTITVAANRPPLAVNDTVSAPRFTGAGPYVPALLTVLGNDSDPDTAIDPTNVINPATVTISTPPNRGGTATVNPDGTISYTPRRNFGGSENFGYRVLDTRNAQSLEATVRVNIQ